MSDIESLSTQALADIAAAETPDALEALRVGLLGKNGSITTQLKSLGALPGDQRKAAGEAINRARDALAAALAERKAKLGDLAGIDEYSFDDDYRTCLRHLQAMEPGTPGLPHIRSALQSGVTAVLSGLMIYIGLAFAGVI